MCGRESVASRGMDSDVQSLISSPIFGSVHECDRQTVSTKWESEEQ